MTRRVVWLGRRRFGMSRMLWAWIADVRDGLPVSVVPAEVDVTDDLQIGDEHPRASIR